MLKKIKYHINYKVTIILFLLIAYSGATIAQSQEIKEKNLVRLDSFLKEGIKDLCRENLVNRKKYKPAKIKTEQQIVSFLNKIYAGNLAQSELTKELFQLRRLKFFRNTEEHGAVLTETIVLRGPYLNSEINLVFIDGILVSAKAEIETGDNTRCGEYGFIVPDFYLFRNSYAENFNFPIYPGYYGLTADTIFFENLKSIAGKLKEYRFVTHSSIGDKWLNAFLLKQFQPGVFCCYSAVKAPNEFIRLIKEDKIETIEELLYSPNCLVAVDAMEALIYLASVNRIELSEEINNRINKIKTENFKFLKQMSYDVFYTINNYSELRMDNDRVIEKYRQSMR